MGFGGSRLNWSKWSEKPHANLHPASGDLVALSIIFAPVICKILSNIMKYAASGIGRMLITPPTFYMCTYSGHGQ